MEIQFQSRWFEKCIRDYLGIADRKITTEDVSVIKYLYVSTTDGYFLGFGRPAGSVRTAGSGGAV